MPQPGEIRRGTTESVQWDGSRWQPLPQADEKSQRYQPGLGDDYTSAFMREIGRTGKEAAIGLARSPLDLVKNTVGMIAHPITTVENTAHAIAHPVDTFNAIGDDPRTAGSMLGQLLIAPKLPGLAETAAAEGPGVIGRGLGTVGRGMETAGSAVLDRGGIPLGMTAAGTAASGHPLAAAAEIGVPLAAKYGGKGLQAVGRSLEGLKRATAPKAAAAGPTTLSGLELSPEALARNVEATNLRDVEGFGHDVAGKLAGIPGAGKAVVSDVSAPSELADVGTAAPPEPPASASMRGLENALTADRSDPMMAIRDDAVRRYLAKFAGLPTDEDIAATVGARNASGKWPH